MIYAYNKFFNVSYRNNRHIKTKTVNCLLDTNRENQYKKTPQSFERGVCIGGERGT